MLGNLDIKKPPAFPLEEEEHRGYLPLNQRGTHVPRKF